LSQELVIKDALKNAGVEPSRISFIETHGTGTALGDPIEVGALRNALGLHTRCALGALKSQIGHTEGAAGIAGVIKTILALRHKIIPPNLHFRTLNPHILLDGSALFIPTEPTRWEAPAGKRFAGVSSFGFGGTNGHVILEEAPETTLLNGDAIASPAIGPVLLPLSAKSDGALKELVSRWREMLVEATENSLRDLVFTASVRRSHYPKRLAVVGADCAELRAKLSAVESVNEAAGIPRGDNSEPARVAFVFSGQGPQWWAMGRELMASEPVYRNEVERIDALARKPAGFSIIEELARSEIESCLQRTDVAQLALFALQMGLAALWKSWGVEPEAVVGHSIGEVAAACAAGALTLEDAVTVACHRGRLMRRDSGRGRMAALEISVADAEKLIAPYGGRLSLAAVNTPESVTLSGEESALNKVLASLEKRGVTGRLLKVDYAFHSPVMEAVKPELRGALRGLSPAAPAVPIVSTVTGEFAHAGDFGADYWPENIRRPVLFSQSVDRLIADGCTAFLEIAPHPVLSTSVAQRLEARGVCGSVVPSLRRGRPERETMLTALGALYMLGQRVEWHNVCARGRVASLPTYPWQQKHFWLELRERRPARSAATESAEISPAHVAVKPADMLFETIWRPWSVLSHPLRPGKKEFLPDLERVAKNLRQKLSDAHNTPSTGLERAAVAAFDNLSVQYIVRALRQLQWQPPVGSRFTLDDLLRALKTNDRHRQLAARMMEILDEEKILRATDAGWEVLTALPADASATTCRVMRDQFPDYRAELDMFERCASRLAEVMQGRCDPLELLFPESSLESAIQVYADSTMSRNPNALVAEFIESAAKSLPAGGVLRVLELGAGTGGTTMHLLPLLKGVPCEYVFTDVSKLFLQWAQAKFREFPFLRYRLLDIEQPPETQGLALHQFDVIIAANVLHATRDLRQTLAHARSLLAPGGMLAMVEGFRPARWIDLVFGQTEGWCRFTDVGLRTSHPLLSLEKWDQVLRETGFADVCAVPAQLDDRPNVFEQAVIMAKTSAAPAPRMETKPQADPAAWLLFEDGSPLCGQVYSLLAAQGHRVARVQKGGNFAPVAEGVYQVDAAQRDQVERGVTAALASLRSPCAHALCLWGPSATDKEGAEKLYEEARSLYLDVVHAVQALSRAQQSQKPRFWVVTQGAQPAGITVPDLRASPLWGLGRVLAVEHPDIWGGLVDVDPEAQPRDNADAIIAQALQPEGEKECAFRSGVRFVPRLMPQRESGERPLEWPADGCHIVAGGLSGVGLHLAEWLASQGARKIVLVGRTPLPPRAEWETVPRGGRAFEQIARIREIERHNSGVKTMAVDITDEHSLRLMLQTLQADGWLPVRGVIHAAGATEDRLVKNLDTDASKCNLRPKILGALSLEACLADQPLQFFVCCSSIASLLSQPGQADYSAANAFLDAFVHHRRARQQPAIGVNWGGWHDTGLALTSGGKLTLMTLAQQGFLDFLPAQGTAALELLLRRRSTQATVVQMDWTRFRHAHPTGTESPLLADLAAHLDPAPKLDSKKTAAAQNDQFRDKLLALDSAPARRSLLEEHLKSILASVLRLETSIIDTSKTMGSHGLDSLMGFEFKNRCEQSLGLSFPVTMVWNYPTIAALAGYLADKLGVALTETPLTVGPARKAPDAPPSNDRAAAVISTVAAFSDEEALRALLKKGSD
jgi:microcystin synthetase protein McyG